MATIAAVSRLRRSVIALASTGMKTAARDRAIRQFEGALGLAHEGTKFPMNPETAYRRQSSNPLVSIIVNNYNYAHFLKDAINSALAQAYDNTEVIVVDDGSTDNSREVMRSYGNLIIPVLKTHGGQASALNTGFERSRGEIVIFLDSDDFLSSGMAGRTVDVFRSNPGLAKVQCRMEVVDFAGRPTGALMPASHLSMLSGDLRRHVLTFPHDVVSMPTSANAFSARVLGQIFPIPEDQFPILADQYLGPLAPLFGPVMSLGDVLVYYRIHGANNYTTPLMSLAMIRKTIVCWDHSSRWIERFARAQLKHDTAIAPLSVAFLMLRAISLKLEPEAHPVGKDRGLRLLRLGTLAAFRRFDVSLGMKVLYVLWFLAMILAPSGLARSLAVRTMYPEKRVSINKVLKFLKAREALS